MGWLIFWAIVIIVCGIGACRQDAREKKEAEKLHQELLRQEQMLLRSSPKAYAQYQAQKSTSASTTQKGKDASVIGRAAAGAVIAGPAGAVVGAISAADKNSRKAKK
jgi:hypothetical protein